MGSTLSVSHTIRNHAHHTLTEPEDGKGVPAGGVGVFYTVRIGINGKGNIITDGDGMIAAHEFSIANVRDLQIAVKQDFKQRKQRGSYFSAFDICYFHTNLYTALLRFFNTQLTHIILIAFQRLGDTYRILFVAVYFSYGVCIILQSIGHIGKQFSLHITDLCIIFRQGLKDIGIILHLPL